MTDSSPPSHVWAGFNYTWELLSHRIAQMRVMPDGDGAVALQMVGGDWSTGARRRDDPFYRVRTHRIHARDFVVVHGETPLIIDPSGEAIATETLNAPGVLAMPEQVIVLRGFDINTAIPQPDAFPTDYDPAQGYTTRGVGLSVSAPTKDADGNALRFQVAARLRWGPLDREDMNAAMQHAQTAMTVGWTAIGFAGSVASHAVSDEAAYPHAPPYSKHPLLGEETMRIDDLPPRPGFTAIRRMDLVLDAQDGSDKGVYVRAIGAEILSRKPGIPQRLLAAGSNASMFEEVGVTFRPSAELLWLHLADKEAKITMISQEGQHPVGAFHVSGHEK